MLYNMIELEDWVDGKRAEPVALELWKPPMFQEFVA